jgi:hypothetical protein
MPITTCAYFLLLLVGFGLQYACDARCIAETGRHLHLSVSRIRWLPLALLVPGLRFERCYRVCFCDQHGRASTRLCRVTGVLGLPMEVAFAPGPFDGVPR